MGAILTPCSCYESFRISPPAECAISGFGRSAVTLLSAFGCTNEAVSHAVSRVVTFRPSLPQARDRAWQHRGSPPARWPARGMTMVPRRARPSPVPGEALAGGRDACEGSFMASAHCIPAGSCICAIRNLLAGALRIAPFETTYRQFNDRMDYSE